MCYNVYRDGEMFGLADRYSGVKAVQEVHMANHSACSPERVVIGASKWKRSQCGVRDCLENNYGRNSLLVQFQPLPLCAH